MLSYIKTESTQFSMKQKRMEFTRQPPLSSSAAAKPKLTVCVQV